MNQKKTALLALVLIAIFVAGVMAGYVWRSVTIPFIVKEPLELIEPPTSLELYAGKHLDFNLTVKNLADVSYLVTLTFALNDTEYESYVTFSEVSGTVTLGLNTFEAWVEVAPDAPSANLTLTVDFTRAAPP